MNWTNKLIQFGIPQNLATRMSQDLQKIPYIPEQFTSIEQLVPIMRNYGFEALNWWSDLEIIMQQIIQLIPGFVLIGVGAAMAYFLKDVKIKKIPLALIGLIPLGIGTYVTVKPFLPTEE